MGLEAPRPGDVYIARLVPRREARQYADRTLGVSGFNIWRELYLCFLRKGAKAARTELEVDWENLQRPGFSPDFYEPSPADSMPYSIGTKIEDWEPNVRGAAFRPPHEQWDPPADQNFLSAHPQPQRRYIP